MLFDLAMPCGIQSIQAPCVLEGRTIGMATYRRCIVGFGIERRIKMDQVYRLAVHPTYDIKVAACPNGLVDAVGISQDRFPMRSSYIASSTC